MIALYILALILGGSVIGYVLCDWRHRNEFGAGYVQGFQDGANETLQNLGAGFSDLNAALVKALSSARPKAKGTA